MYDEVVSAYDQPIEFVVGFAGSGKSTELANRFSDSNTLVLTPTHKAKEVLFCKGVANVATIHSVLKLVPTLNMEMRRGQKMQKLKQIGDLDLTKITDIGIDEFSMINTEILDKLLETLPSHCKVTVFGDPYQLEPIDGDLVCPEDYTDKITELTTQHRAKAPRVVETFMRFKDFIAGGGMDLTITTNGKDLVSGTTKGFNPDTDRALAFTNAKVLELNDRIGQELGLPKKISIGEEITINGISGTLVEAPFDDFNTMTIYPKCVSKGKLMDGEKLRIAIQTVKADMRKFKTKIPPSEVGYIEIDGTVYKFMYDLDHYANSKAFKANVEESQFDLIEYHELKDDVKLKEWCADNRDAKGVRERGKAWSTFLAHQGLVWDKRRPFASTVHKAQGQEFSRVFIAQEDMKKMIKGKYYKKYARLMYVALSRAIDKVIIIK